MRKNWISSATLILGVVLLAAIPRIALLFYKGYEIFNADQAMFGLMAKHILEGHPMIYYYGQAYNGPLQAWLTLFFAFFVGWKDLAIQLGPFVLYLGFVAFTFLMIQKIWDRWHAVVTSLLLALAPFMVTWQTAHALAGLSETLCFASLMLLFVALSRGSKKRALYLFIAGIAGGFGFWGYTLILFYFMALFLFWWVQTDFWNQYAKSLNLKKILNPHDWLKAGKDFLKTLLSTLPFALGYFIGSFPVYLYRWMGGNEYQPLRQSGLIEAEQVIPQLLSVLERSWLYATLGVKLSWLKSWQGIPSLVSWLLILITLFLGLRYLTRYGPCVLSLLRLQPRKKYDDAAFPMLLCIIVFLLVAFHELQADRYYIAWAFCGSVMLTLALATLKKPIATALLICILGSHTYLHVHEIRNMPDLSKQEAGFRQTLGLLESKGIKAGYANYWLSYLFTFWSLEEIIIAPYQSQDRYPKYTEFADKESKVAYIFFKKRDLFKDFQKKLDEDQISYEKILMEPLWIYLVDRTRGRERK